MISIYLLPDCLARSPRVLGLQELFVDLLYAVTNAQGSDGERIVFFSSRSPYLPLHDGSLELVVGVAAVAAQPEVDDAQRVEEGDRAVDIDGAEHGKDVFCLDGVFYLHAVDHKTLFHDRGMV